MEEQFIAHKHALALKELGFDEPCLAFWDGKNTDAFYFNNIRDASGDYVPFQKHDRLKWFGAPLKSQVFEWFREKYNLVFNFISYNIVKPAEYHWSITWNDEAKTSGIVKTYEEAESACIDKLIELCHDK